MSPRHADVAFVLEGVAGVNALYAITPGTRAAAHFDFAVELTHGGRVLAEAHYALLRVMSHDDCARVFLFHTTAPEIIATAARPLRLEEADRAAARSRVPAPVARGDFVPAAASSPLVPSVLVVDEDVEVQRVVTEVLGDANRSVIAKSVGAAVDVAKAQSFDLILCDARRAFGSEGLLAKLPLDVASRVLVLVRPSEYANARWRLQGTHRILRRPLEAWVVRERLTRIGTVNPLWPADVTKIVAADRPPRQLTEPDASAPFTVLLADVDHDVHDGLRRILQKEERQIVRREPEEAVDLALTSPFHLLVCSATAALGKTSFLDGIAREDPAGAERVLVAAATRDVQYVKHKLAEMGRKNTVLAIPIDDTTLRREVFRNHPAVAARVAVAEVAGASADADADARKLERPRFRRLSVLVVDDDQTTQILFAAADRRQEVDVDVALATSPMDAFEHVVSQPVDLLVISATMRGDGGEPLYRVLWRLKPELKSRCVLIVAPNAAPPSSRSAPSRVVERPLTRDAVATVVETFARR